MLKELTLTEEHLLIMNVKNRKNLNESFNKLIKHYSHKILLESENCSVKTKNVLNKSDATACIYRALYQACSVFDCSKEKPLWSIASYFIKKFVTEETETSKGIVKSLKCKYIDDENIDSYSCHNECGLRDVIDKLPDCKKRRIKYSTNDIYFEDNTAKTNNMNGENMTDKSQYANQPLEKLLNTGMNTSLIESEFVFNKLSKIPKQQQLIIKDLFGLDSQNPLSIAYIAYKNNISVNRAEELKEEGFMRLKEKNIKRNDSHFLTL